MDQATLVAVAVAVPVLGTYLALIRPAMRQRQQHAALLVSLKPGDRVVTRGGLIGIVDGLDGKVVVMKMGAGLLVDVLRECIAGRVTP